MEKLILCVKRKPGLTQEQFRAHYESTHAPLAWSSLQPWLVRYTRNFLKPLPGQDEPPWDCVTEFWFTDRAALEAAMAWTRSNPARSSPRTKRTSWTARPCARSSPAKPAATEPGNADKIAWSGAKNAE
jgi:EthD domain